MKRRFDLHVHTTASDGTLEPEEVVVRAVSAGLWCVAVTDHDTAEGVDRAMDAGRRLGLPVIPGAEFSAQFDGELHILGYGLDPHSTGWAAFIAEQQKRRLERNEGMLKRLEALGLALPAEYLPSTVSGTYGRMHMARGLMAMGAVATPKEAFERYLMHGAKAYVPRRKFTSQELLAAIAACGGQAVLAHPGRIGLGQWELRALVGELVGLGLTGLEVYYPSHSTDEMHFFAALAQEMNLVCTYGSDWHGQEAGLAARFGDFTLPERTYQWIASLLERGGELQ